MSESSKTWLLTCAVMVLVLMTFQVDVQVGNTVGPNRVVRRPILRAVWDVAKTAAVSLLLSPLTQDPSLVESSGERYFAAHEIPAAPVVRSVGPTGEVVLNNAEGW